MDKGVVAEGAGPGPSSLLRWSGAALVAGGLLLVVATVLHPSVETATSILETEKRLVASHVLFTSSFLAVLLGLPGLYVIHSVRMGRLGFVGFLGSFAGCALIAVTGNFGFLAPVLAAQAPDTLDTLTSTRQSSPSTRWPPSPSWSASSCSAAR